MMEELVGMSVVAVSCGVAIKVNNIVHNDYVILIINTHII